ncbi:MAG: chromosome segregation protein SMC [Lachnospiraceae bacterium]|nr:chromosome segregation protein SMC [Lachnospiraceae bacterium]
MYLKSIEVHGFKSFANKIDFQFHNGITGIVGPNGSGKSNVADAVRWVLGEQSARQLRGASMQDVIFSGTQSRRPMGYASVAITLDNSDRQLSVDYEEVTVTRRVYRSGESEYLINGTPCRLRDINELFYDTGIGKEGYSIIGQGQIERILSGKPEDRRELFDEAAGIVKFKRRKAAAIKKLDEEQGNFTRVNDILSELEKQVGPLERQSEKARIYLRKREELKHLDVNVFLLETQRLSQQLEDMKKKHDIAAEELKETSDKFESTRDEFDEMQDELGRLDALLEEKNKEISDAQITRQKLEGEIAVLNEQINSAKNSQEHFLSRKEALKEQVREKDAELSGIKKTKKEIDRQAQEAVEKRNDAKESAQALAGSIQHISQSIERLKQSIIDALSFRNDISTRLSKYDTQVEQINIEKAQLASRLLRAKTEEEEIKAEEDEREKAFKEVCRQLADLDAKLADNERAIGDISEKLRELEAEKSQAEASFHETNSKLESLRNMAERYEGYGNATRRIMEKKDNRIYGVVADILQVDKKYETAIETALGGNIQNIVTKDEASAKEMIAFLKKERLGRATFLPLTSVKEREFTAPDALKEKGVIGLADTLVKLDDKYKNVASHLLHNYIVVDNIDNGLALARKFNFTLRIVTVSGEALNPGGSISGGAFKNNSNLLGRKREMDELEKLLKETKDKVDKTADAIEKTRDERTEMRGVSAKIRDEQQEKFIEQNTAKMNLDRAKERREEMKDGFSRLHNEEADIASKLAQIESDKNKTAKELESSQRSEQDIQKKIEEQSAILKQRQDREADILAGLSQLDVEAAQLSQKQEFEAGNLERVEGEKKRLQEELDFVTESLKTSGQDSEEKQLRIGEIQKTIEASIEADRKWSEEIENTRKMKEEITAKQRDFMLKRDELSDKKGSLDKEVYRLSGQIERIKEQSDSQYSYMWNEYEITMSQAREQRDDTLTDLSAMKKEIISIKGSIRELGDVNVNAIEAYKELMERYEFMRTQRDDIVEAKESLEKVIAELDEGMKKQFSEKFAQIAKQFDKVFKEMFGGGTGTLELLEDEDILEAGIRIIAQPPGKKFQNMMQLSGGEKALTAIALLFAIQNLKPSPFCLLDEIEAALDESNVGRFAGYLQKLTKSTQFIVITHRRGTMEKADRLYGITMQEKGVSALVSVDLIDDKDLK